MPRSIPRHAAQARRPKRLHPVQLHVFSFDFFEAGGFRHAATVLVRGRMGQVATISLAGEQARAFGHAMTPSVRARTSGDARQVATAS